MITLKQIEVVLALTEMKSAEIAHLVNVDPLTAEVLRNALSNKLLEQSDEQ